MGILERFLLGGKMEAEEQHDRPPQPIAQLSDIANSVVFRCSKILELTVEMLQQRFDTEFHDNVEQPSVYARSLVQYCSYKALDVMTKRPDHLADKEFCHLTFDMMLACETPDTEGETLPRGTICCKDLEFEDDDGSLFYTSSTNMAMQVDGKKTVGLDAFVRIASGCPAVADPITVHNLFDVLTCSSGGQLHFLIYEKYLKGLDRMFNSAKCISEPPLVSNLQLTDGEIILDVDGVMPTQPVLQHIGISAWPGRLTLTNNALYFESLGVGAYNKAVRYDLATDLKQVIKRELTGPWGARLFDSAVMYKSNFLAEPIFFEFPQFKGHSRRDYWFAIIREVLNVHKFIRKYNLGQIQRAEALSKATIGIFQYRAVKEAFHIIPCHVKTTLAFTLAEKLPKGDKILEALYNHLKLLYTRSHVHVEASSDEKHQTFPFPVSLYTLTRMGFMLLEKKDMPEEQAFPVADIRVSETIQLQIAVKKSVNFSGRVEAARATLDQIKVEGIDTNLAVMKELLFPFVELGNRLLFLAEWEDPFKSSVFLFFVLFVIYRGWVRYIFPSIFVSLAVLMLWHKHLIKGKTIEAFQITPPPAKNPVEQLLTLQDVVTQLETYIQTGNIALLKLRAIMFAAFPQTTNKVAATLVGSSLIFALVPFKHLFMLALLEVYTREMPLRKESSEKLIRRIREWWVRIPAAPVLLIKPQEHKKAK